MTGSVRRAGPDPLVTEHHMIGQQVRQPGLLGQFEQRNQTSGGHQIPVVEHRRIRPPTMR